MPDNRHEQPRPDAPQAAFDTGPEVTLLATYRLPLVDTGDGSGDAFLPLPDDVLVALGWNIGDTLSINVVDQKEIQIRKT